MAGFLGLAVGSAGALSLGPAQGQVLLGRPIDVSFEVHLDAGMSLETACLAADIVSGDNPLGRGQVQVTPLPSVAGRGHAVRVQSSRQADEPVLTIRLSAGCTGTITRSYVFLVDLPESIVPSTTPIAIPWVEPPAPPSAPERGVAGGAGEPAASAKPTSRSDSASPPPVPGDARPQASAEPPAARMPAPPVRPARASAPAARKRPAKPPVAAASQPAPVGPRLVMEPLAVVLGPAAGASAAASAPAVSLPASAAEGTVPVALDTPASQPEAAADSPAAQALKDELATLRMQAASDRAEALALQLRLERIESERFHPGVVYGLLGLVAVMLAWMVWQVLRFRMVFEQSSQAWSESVAMHERKDSQSQA